jgi:hypothetical protein
MQFRPVPRSTRRYRWMRNPRTVCWDGVVQKNMHTMVNEALAHRNKRRFYSPEIKSQIPQTCRHGPEPWRQSQYRTTLTARKWRKNARSAMKVEALAFMPLRCWPPARWTTRPQLGNTYLATANFFRNAALLNLSCNNNIVCITFYNNIQPFSSNLPDNPV